MCNLLVVFSHGKESGPWGSKIATLARVAQARGAQVISIDYREDPPGVAHHQDAAGEADRRVHQLLSIGLPAHHKLVLVGSSMGGYVSTVCSTRITVDGLFLLAPAFYLPGYDVQCPVTGARNTLIVHGWGDTVVPMAHSVQFARDNHCELYALQGDHRLNGALPQIERVFGMFLDRVMQAGDADAGTIDDAVTDRADDRPQPGGVLPLGATSASR